ncbi:MAG: tRNA (N6-isopentenyl adenosine(37)-C2)-methylthiotransferase MiaB [Selenomonadaceae bacterium]|nr:tRNA (N6-isopentenyl adenosine(37)-C2)-methylthiotransferase MiaB [Selenomonadaceae bacterium]
MLKKLKIITYGCQMNVADSQRMAARLETIGYAPTDEFADADLILINTCSVRDSAEEKILGKIGELKQYKRRKPSLIIGVTGCMAQKEGDALIERAPHVDFVLGTGRQTELIKIVRLLESFHRHIVDVEGMSDPIVEELYTPRGTHSAFIPIMYGCNNFCTYCIVPHVRGRERSRQPQDIIREARAAVDNGTVEITLLGQNVNSYAHGFPQLLTEISRLDGLKRLRFMTSHPKDLSDELIEVMASEPTICEHLHLPVQHGSDRLLQRMNRGYTVERYRRLVEKLRAAIPNIALTTDLIAGFPGETDDDVDRLLEFVREIRFDAAFTFIYSKRSGTPAATFDDQIDDRIKHERLERLMAVQNKISREINDRLAGSTVEILVEGASKSDEKIFSGRTRTNKPVLFRHGDERAGDLIRVRITQPQTWLLKAERVE